MNESKRPQGKYKTTNWKTYNAALKARVDLPRFDGQFDDSLQSLVFR